MKIRPKLRRTLRALGGRRVVIEGYGRRAPALVVITGGNEGPCVVWLSPTTLRQMVDAARRILR